MTFDEHIKEEYPELNLHYHGSDNDGLHHYSVMITREKDMEALNRIRAHSGTLMVTFNLND